MSTDQIVQSQRRLLQCIEPDCTAAWYQMGSDHYRAVRRAIQAGWTGSGSGGCLCIDTAVRCPRH